MNKSDVYYTFIKRLQFHEMCDERIARNIKSYDIYAIVSFADKFRINIFEYRE